MTWPALLPCLVVVDTRASAWPWSLVSTRAASTLQVVGLIGWLEDPGVRATLGYAIEQGLGRWAFRDAETAFPIADEFACVGCGHRVRRVRPAVRAVDPSKCGFCNP